MPFTIHLDDDNKALGIKLLFILDILIAHCVYASLVVFQVTNNDHLNNFWTMICSVFMLSLSNIPPLAEIRRWVHHMAAPSGDCRRPRIYSLPLLRALLKICWLWASGYFTICQYFRYSVRGACGALNRYFDNRGSLIPVSRIFSKLCLSNDHRSHSIPKYSRNNKINSLQYVIECLNQKKLFPMFRYIYFEARWFDNK